MHEREPGNLMDRLPRLPSETRQYKFIELYADSAALRAHGESPHFRASLHLMEGGSRPVVDAWWRRGDDCEVRAFQRRGRQVPVSPEGR
ncbi:antibiotic biosynthesis monooxygenase [Rhodococcus koreensis]|uniref:antibiotic biosynthesis monooxygenase n=1 Tax=Rhodococcus koreensis TaxID=99653 RepID=UPI0036701999